LWTPVEFGGSAILKIVYIEETGRASRKAQSRALVLTALLSLKSAAAVVAAQVGFRCVSVGLVPYIIREISGIPQSWSGTLEVENEIIAHPISRQVEFPILHWKPLIHPDHNAVSAPVQGVWGCEEVTKMTALKSFSRQ